MRRSTLIVVIVLFVLAMIGVSMLAYRAGFLIGADFDSRDDRAAQQ